MRPLKNSEYPEGAVLAPLPKELSYAATVDIRNVEHEITEFMVLRACEEMESQQQYPFCSANKTRSSQG